MEAERFFLITEAQLASLRSVAKRLYTENRMNGDEMRDAAHAITAVVRAASDIPVPELPCKEGE